MFKRSAILALILTLLFVIPALAQNGDTPPADLNGTIMALMSTIAALLGSAVVDWIKALPFLKDEDKSKLTGPTAQLVSVVANIAAGYLVALAGQALGLIPDAGLQALIVTMATPALAELRYRVAKLAPVEK